MNAWDVYVRNRSPRTNSSVMTSIFKPTIKVVSTEG